MSKRQIETIKRLRAEIAELMQYKKQAIRLMKRNDELLNQLKDKN